MADGRRKAQQELTSRPQASLRQIARTAGVSPATVKDVRDRMRRGEDPVPRNQHGLRAARAAGRPGTGHDDGDDPAGARDLARSLHQLSKDPSVRYTESGRALLQWLEAHARGPGPVAALIDTVPSHCGYLIADIARTCSRQWQELATALDQRLRAGHTASRDQHAAPADAQKSTTTGVPVGHSPFLGAPSATM